MANQLFNKGREGILNAAVAMTGDVRVMLVRSTYVFDNTDQFVSDLGAVDNGRSASLTSKTYTDGVFDASDSTLIASAAVACNACILFIHTGADASARLIAYLDTPTGGLPFTPAAAQPVDLVWDNGANKIFKL